MNCNSHSSFPSSCSPEYGVSETPAANGYHNELVTQVQSLAEQLFQEIVKCARLLKDNRNALLNPIDHIASMLYFRLLYNSETDGLERAIRKGQAESSWMKLRIDLAKKSPPVKSPTFDAILEILNRLLKVCAKTYRLGEDVDAIKQFDEKVRCHGICLSRKHTAIFKSLRGAPQLRHVLDDVIDRQPKLKSSQDCPTRNLKSEKRLDRYRIPGLGCILVSSNFNFGTWVRPIQCFGWLLARLLDEPSRRCIPTEYPVDLLQAIGEVFSNPFCGISLSVQQHLAKADYPATWRLLRVEAHRLVLQFPSGEVGWRLCQKVFQGMVHVVEQPIQSFNRRSEYEFGHLLRCFGLDTFLDLEAQPVADFRFCQFIEPHMREIRAIVQDLGDHQVNGNNPNAKEAEYEPVGPERPTERYADEVTTLADSHAKDNNCEVCYNRIDLAQTKPPHVPMKLTSGQRVHHGCIYRLIKDLPLCSYRSTMCRSRLYYAHRGQRERGNGFNVEDESFSSCS